MFVKPEAFKNLTPSDLIHATVLEECNLLATQSMFIGSTPERMMTGAKWGKQDKLRQKFLESVKTAYVNCAQSLLTKE